MSAKKDLLVIHKSFPRHHTHMRAEGWLPMSTASTKGPCPVKGYEQVLLAYHSFTEEGETIVGMGCFMEGIPSTASIDYLIEAREKGEDWSPHVFMTGWYVTFTTLVQHGGKHYNACSQKPTQVRVVPFAWKPLPVFK